MVSEVNAMRPARERSEPDAQGRSAPIPLRRIRNTFFKLLYRYTHPRAFHHNERLGRGVSIERDAAGRLTGMSIDGQHLPCVNGMPLPVRDAAECHLIATGPSINAIDYDVLPMPRAMGVNGAIALRRKYDVRFDYYCIVDAGFVRNHGELVDLIVAEPLTLFATPTVLWHIAQRCAPSRMRCRVFLLDEMLFPAGSGALEVAQLRAAHGAASLAWFDAARPLGFSLDIRRGVFEGRTVAYTGLQVLASLGFRRIYLHGLDLVDAARTPRFYERQGAVQPSQLDKHLRDVIAPSFRHAGALLRRRGVQVTNLSMRSALGEDVLPKMRWQALVNVEERESLCA
jgi:KDO transferase-3